MVNVGKYTIHGCNGLLYPTKKQTRNVTPSQWPLWCLGTALPKCQRLLGRGAGPEVKPSGWGQCPIQNPIWSAISTYVFIIHVQLKIVGKYSSAMGRPGNYWWIISMISIWNFRLWTRLLTLGRFCKSSGCCLIASFTFLISPPPPPHEMVPHTNIYGLEGTNISPSKAWLNVKFLFPRSDTLVPWRVIILTTYK